jgi:membrane associated rhomboid family serine protease
MRNIPVVTKNLLLINVAAFLITYVFEGTGNGSLNDVFGLHFFMASDFHLYQLITYMFMHGGWQHIIFNMIALFMFGCVVERVWGAKKFLFYYLACGVGAGLFQEAAQFVQFYLMASETNPGVSLSLVAQAWGPSLNGWTTVGASGAIYAILLAFGMLFPEERIFIFPLPVPIKAKWFVIGYAAIELYSAVLTSGDGVAHIAHLGGMVFGFFMIRHWRKQNIGGYRSEGTDAFDRLREMLSGFSKHKFRTTRNGSNSNAGGERQQDWDFNARKRAKQEEVDRILDKIRKSGYDSLTKEEKQTLFDQSNK